MRWAPRNSWSPATPAPSYPPAAEELPNLGFAGGLNAEAILEFAPTLVLATPMAGPPGVLEQLEQAGVEVLVIDRNFNSLDAPQIKIRMIGEALGVPQRAEALALDVEQRMEAAIAAAVTETPLRVLLVYIRRGGVATGLGRGQQVAGDHRGCRRDRRRDGSGDRGLAAIDSGGVGRIRSRRLPGHGSRARGGWRHRRSVGDPRVWPRRGRAGGPHIIAMPDLYLLGFGPRLPEAITDLSEFLREVQASITSENE